MKMELSDSDGEEIFMQTQVLDLRSCMLGKAATYTFGFCRMAIGIGTEGENVSYLPKLPINE